MKSVSVFCSSSEGVSDFFYEEIKKIGKLLAEEEYNVIYGGARVGLMGALADSSLLGGAKVTGVIPAFFNKEGIVHESLSEKIVIEDMFERKKLLIEKGDFYIIFPGGIGTLDEAIEVITLKSIGQLDKPILFYNYLDFFTPFIDYLHELRERKMIYQPVDELVQSVSTIGQLADKIKTYH